MPSGETFPRTKKFTDKELCIKNHVIITICTHTKKSWYFLVAPIQSSLMIGRRVVVVVVDVEKYLGHNAQIENAAVSGVAVTSRGPGGEFK